MAQRQLEQARDLPETIQTTITILSMPELEERMQLVQQVMRRVMQRGIHYAVIPGTEKPTLLQPGAEKLAVTFRLAPNFVCMDKVEDWDDGFFAYRFRCELVSQTNGTLMSSGEGSCNSRERRYRNQDAFNVANTVLKMAQKRAFVSAVIKGVGASDLFTQDLEDYDDVARAVASAQQPARPQPEATTETKHPATTEPPAEKPVTLAQPAGGRSPAKWSVFWGKYARWATPTLRHTSRSASAGWRTGRPPASRWTMRWMP